MSALEEWESFPCPGARCRCVSCRHGRFNPGPPSNPRRLNFYGHYKRGALAKHWHRRAIVRVPAEPALPLGWRQLPAALKARFR